MNRLALILFLISTLIAVSETDTEGLENNCPDRSMVFNSLENGPLAFVENRGQLGENTLFKASSGGAIFYFRPNEVDYQFIRDMEGLKQSAAERIKGFSANALDRPDFNKESMLIKVRFLGANPDPAVVGIDRQSSSNNYFYGNDPSKWRTNVASYAAIIYKEIYPGIDLKYYGNGLSMKYDFIVGPGADLTRIAIHYEGVEGIFISDAGDLLLNTAFGPVSESKPHVYQVIGGKKLEMEAGFYLDENNNVGFVVEGADPNIPLIIDPALVYSSYLGGYLDDYGYGIALDGSGYFYVIGHTRSSDFPTSNAYDDSLNGGDDVFVCKFSPSGSSLIYSTFIGGSGNDYGYDIAVDDSGNAYFVGGTSSSDFPLANAYDASYDGANLDGFVTKLSAAGDSLIFSTYLGGAFDDECSAITLDGSENPYVTGYTWSSDFPTVNPFDPNLKGDEDVFVSKFSAAGDSLIYSTFLGSIWGDQGYDIAVNMSGNAFVTGRAAQYDFPTVNAYDSTHNGGHDVFVTKLSAAGNSLDYSTYLGGSIHEYGQGISLDSLDNAYIVGWTESSDFPTTANAFDSSHNAQSDVFLAIISPAGNSLIYSTYMGGGGIDVGSKIDVFNSEYAYFTGYTHSSDFPVINPDDSSHNGSYDVFLAEYSISEDSLEFSTFLGAPGDDYAHDIAVQDSNNVFIIGHTFSNYFPTLNPFQTNQPLGDAFLAKYGELSGCDYFIGDVNASYSYNGLDITYGVAFFKGGNPPQCNNCLLCPDWYYCGDVNASCNYNGLDITYGVNYFKGIGPDPAACQDCPQAP